MRFFHLTSKGSVHSILKLSFMGGPYYYFNSSFRLRGVWLSDLPPECFEATTSDKVLLEVDLDLPPSTLDTYEVVETGKRYREWCLPADLFRTATVCLYEAPQWMIFGAKLALEMSSQ